MDSWLPALVMAPFIGVVIALTIWHERQRPSTRAFVRKRVLDEAVWGARYAGESMTFTIAVLQLLCDVFLLKPDDKWRLRPEDTPREIYEAQYPPGEFSVDTLETLWFVDELQRQFSVPENVALALWEAPIRDLIAACAKYRGRVDMHLQDEP
jgi:hypothetical protein